MQRMRGLLSAVAKSVIAKSIIAKSLIAMSAALIATDASAQLVNLTGRYVCVAVCTPGLQGQFAFITQNGTELNLVNDAGEASRGWVDYPGHIWVDGAHQGAIYSADGMTINSIAERSGSAPWTSCRRPAAGSSRRARDAYCRSQLSVGLSRRSSISAPIALIRAASW
jgi:hypothetical protein